MKKAVPMSGLLALAFLFFLPSNLLSQGFCPTNLLINGSFEDGIDPSGPTSIFLPNGWSGSGIAEFVPGSPPCPQPADGIAEGYTAEQLYQDVTAVQGDVFSLDFYSGFSEAGGTKTVTLQFYDGVNPVGSPVVHIITHPLSTCTFGGPYNLTSLAAPSGVSHMRVSINGDPSEAGLARFAKADAMCLTKTNMPPCIQPSAITLTATPATCDGATEENDGVIALTAATNATHYGISSPGAMMYDGPTTIATATAVPGTLPADILTNAPNAGATYIVRFFNGDDACFVEETVTVAGTVCDCPPPVCQPTGVVKN